MVKISIIIISIFSTFYFAACSSGEYEVKTYKVDYTEKTVKVDTLKKITLNEDKIKQDKNDKENIKENLKETYYYTIQIGAFSMNENSQKFLEKSKAIFGESVFEEDSGNLHKIRIGKYGNRAEAIKFLEQVRSKGFNDAFIVTKKN